MVIKAGIIGLYDKGNGHPFSFSSIINGYSEKGYKKSKYLNILNYLKKKKKKDFKIKNVKITHAWTQNPKITKILCEASKIKYPVKNYFDMIDKIDALIIARDDMHYKISKPFLLREIPVFIDKPLSTNEKELNFFKKYMSKGLLMSTSGFRFSDETKILKNKIKKIGNIKLIVANVSNDRRRYGVHMLDVIDELGFLKIKKIYKINSKFKSFNLINDKKINIIVNCLGKNYPTYNLSLLGDKGKFETDFKDNFVAFKNTLTKFFNMVKNQKIYIQPNRTLNIMKIIKLGLKL